MASPVGRKPPPVKKLVTNSRYVKFMTLERRVVKRLIDEPKIAELLSEVSDFAAFELDLEGICTKWEPLSKNYQRVDQSEIVGHCLEEFYPQSQVEGGQYRRDLQTAAKHGRCDGRGWRPRKDGARSWMHFILLARYDFKGDHVGYSGLVFDATRQKDNMRALGELTGGIAHDFNNLLTVVRGSAELLRHSDLSEEQRDRHLMAIIETADRAAELTGQLLSFARRQPLQPKKIHINALIADMADLLERTLGNGISIVNIPQQDLWQVCVDPAQLQNVIFNAAINARDAMGSSGTLTIATRNISRGADSEVRLSISDTGEGMTDEVRERAFEPFFTTKAPGKGTGLGLSQAYGFAGQSGGRLELLSEPGRGTSLNLYLPRAGEAALPVKSEDQTGKVPQGTRILLVEDSRTVAVFAQSLLEDMGCEFVHAATAEEALAMFEQDPEGFDIVFSDIVMPGLSGLDLAAKLRTQHPTLPILLATGYSAAAARGEGSEFPILPKPYKRDKLSAMLSQAMSDFSQAA